jgi:hypothetical protein
MGRKVRKRLKRFAKQGALVRIQRAIPGTHTTYGFVLAAGAKLVLLALEDEFEIDGFVVLRIDDIQSVRRTKVDRLHDRWMHEAGLDIAGLPLPPVDLRDVRALLRSIEPSSLVLTVEAEHPDHKQFELGCIERVGRKATWMHFLKPNGKWDPVLDKVRHKHVTCVHIEGSYTRMYAQHAPPIEV